jgi:hypothetical protein
VIGESYQTLARMGLSFQRSQNSGRFAPQPGPSVAYYKRLQSLVDAPPKETSFFDGIDVSLPGVFRALGKTAPAGADAALQAIAGDIAAAVDDFNFSDPSAAAPALARALDRTRKASAALGGDADVKFVFDSKARQIADALHAALGITFTAVAQPPGTPDATGPFAVPTAMAPVVPGQAFEVRTTFVNRGRMDVKGTRITIEAEHEPVAGADRPSRDAATNQPLVEKFAIKVPDNARLSRPHFSRASIQDARYTVVNETDLHRPALKPAFEAVARYEVAGVPVEIRRPVTRLEASLPYGNDPRVLAIVPAISISLTPSHAVVPLSASATRMRVTAEVLNNQDGKTDGTVTLSVPSGWKVAPASHSFQFSRPGERERYLFDVSIAALEKRDYRIEAVAASGGREYREGYATIRHRDLETRYLYRAAVAAVRGVDMRMPTGLRVGYVMGVGDDVPMQLAQLGIDVQMLAERDLATADLGRFNAIFTGTRAYAVREDLKTYNRRLLDYVRNGGNLIVLYNTQEFVPKLYAPYGGELPRTAEEVSEEDSPVEILAPDAPVLTVPNRITLADFESWVEQRGSKFWTTWDAQYTPIISTWDKGQPPQKGGWLQARYGKGYYTYFAYAFHRQLPYGVPGAYRLLANLLSLNQPPPAVSNK